jgi:Undecaprenyl-phosphate galactose phosphotransferase WbaP
MSTIAHESGLALSQLEVSRVDLPSKQCNPRLSALTFVVADTLAVSLTILISAIASLVSGGQLSIAEYFHFSAVLVLFAAVNAMNGLYPGVTLSAVTEIRKLFAGTTLVFLVLWACALFQDQQTRVIFLSWAFGLFAVPLTRAAMRHLLSRTDWWGYPVIVFTDGESGREVVRTLKAHPERGLRPVAVFDDQLPNSHSLCGVPVLGAWVDSARFRKNISHAIIACRERGQVDPIKWIEAQHLEFTNLIVVSGLPGCFSSEVLDFCRLSAVQIRNNLTLPGPRVAKRIIDLTLALTIAVLSFPLLAIIALVLKLESSGPMLFSHCRIGRGGKRFRVWKFRSMVADGDRVLARHLELHPEAREQWEADRKLRVDPRVTRVGRLLRRTSLDELPQLWNVICGDMSLVGPRPIVQDEVARYGQHYSLYRQVTPGLTGLWQVSGRNKLTYAERVALDTYYVRNWSPWLDIYLLMRTVLVVLRAEGAY